jgi:hypothetical protein
MIVTRYWPAILKEYGKTDISPQPTSTASDDEIEIIASNKRPLSKPSESELVAGDMKLGSGAYLGVREHSNTGSTNPQADTGELQERSGVSIFEAPDTIQEIDFVAKMIEPTSRRVVIVVPNKDLIALLANRSKMDGLEYSVLSGTYADPESIDDSLIDEISKYFKGFIEPSDDRFGKLIEELAVLLPNDGAKESNLTITDDIRQLKDLEFETVICMSMNENSWQVSDCNEYWLHQYIRQKIGLPSKKMANQRIENAFYWAINNAENVLITRSKRIGGINVRKSSILAKFEMICRKSKIELQYIEPHPKEPSGCYDLHTREPIIVIPGNLSVNGMELLMRDPRGFFVRHVLGLIPKPIDDDQENLSISFKKLMRAYFTKQDDIETILDTIKHSDFFHHQKCINIIEWLDTQAQFRNNDDVKVYHGIRGGIILEGFGVELYGYIDRLEIFRDHASIISFQAHAPSPPSELLRGEGSALLGLCLIADEHGFLEIEVPITEAKIFSIANREPDPLSMKTVDISKEVIADFKGKIYETLGRYEMAESIEPDSLHE